MGRRWLLPALAGAALLLVPAAAAELMSVAVEKANVREGPGLENPVLWQAWRFTPFEVLEWSGAWIYIEDFVGDTGWLHQSVLSETPAVIVAGKYANIRKGPGMDYEVLWTVEREYPLKVLERDGDWLKVSDEEELEGWIYGKLVWGNKEPEINGL
ncbi:MAG: SH3 domain-containing protein [Elusimicrobia bacterium]|nr:SH3 domain-containing protein [Elusimicrobiota bacterium]